MGAHANEAQESWLGEINLVQRINVKIDIELWFVVFFSNVTGFYSGITDQ